MLADILKMKDNFDVFLFDMFGVIWDGKKIVDGALETMETLKREGKIVKVLSNATVRGVFMESKYIEKGIFKNKHFDEVVTSGDVARDTFLNDDRALKFYQFSERRPELFEGTKYVEISSPEDADFIYIGTPLFEGKNQLTVEPFEAELNKLFKMDKPLVCVNPDMLVYEGSHDEPVIRQGSIARYYEDLGGEVEYFGKPYPLVYDYALRDYEGDDARVLMIGDTLETDILGANSYGIKSALVSGGISSDNMKKEGFESLEEYAEELQIIPDFFL